MAWTAYLRGLVARGLSGAHRVISDAHGDLKDAIASMLPSAGWPPCRTHFMRNPLAKVPKSAHELVAPLVCSIFEQPDADSAWPLHARVLEQRFGDAADLLAETGDEILAFTAFPKATGASYGRTTRYRLNKESRRRTGGAGSSPTAPR